MQAFFTKKPRKMGICNDFEDIDDDYVNNTRYGIFFERSFLYYSKIQGVKIFFAKMFDEPSLLCYSV